jgi:predicted transcriptional regulator
MITFIASKTVNGNEAQLIRESGWHYINWGEASHKGKTRTRIETLKGRKPSINQVNKRFLEACKAAEYIKFSRL